MTDAEFEAKLAKWKARGPKPKKPPRTKWYRVASKQIDKDKFDKHVAAVTAGRRKYEAELMMADRIDGVIT